MPLYPNPPAERIAYDRDGTIVVDAGSGIPVSVSSANVIATNVEDGTRTFNQFNSGNTITGTNNVPLWALIFPRLMDISHFFWLSPWVSGTGTSTGRALESSTNTTNGLDGTWNTISAGASGAQHAYGATSISNRRTVMAGGIHSCTANNTGIKAIRFGFVCSTGEGYRVGPVHLYGKPTTFENLVFWHPTLDQPLSNTPELFDFEDKPRLTTTDKSFRIKNMNSLTAVDITVSMDALQDGTPTLVSQHTFNYNGGGYAATASLSSLAPGAVSEVFGVRQSLLSNAPLGLYAQRIHAVALGWS